ncbi:MAG: deoxyribose-phosphate aldolase [Bacteroidota bacterium]
MSLAKYIDHTLLKPTATETEIRMLCEEALAYGFKAVCVNGCWVAFAFELLKDSEVRVATVVGFPLGAMSTDAKVTEAEDAVNNGADEVDMVLNLGWLKSEQYDRVQEDMDRVKKAVGNSILKVILETCYLNDDEIEKACELAVAARADFVKTSTGFGTGGATFEDVLLMRTVVGDKALIKASGGVRDRETALRYISIGVSRIGTSSGVKLLTE